MGRSRWILFGVLVFAVAVPAAALALTRTVAPTPSQRAAVLRAWAGGPVSSAQSSCLIVRLAAANHRYATVRFRRTTYCENHWAFNGVNVIKHQRNGHWKVVFEGSAFSCPLPHIPLRVQRDFRICP